MTRVACLGLAALLLAGLGTAEAQNRQGRRRGQVRPGAHAAPANPVPWSLAAGRPQIHPGKTVGYFIWHQGNVVRVVTTSTSKAGLNFAGQIRVAGGTLSAPAGVRDERKDIWKQVSPQEIDFSFDTHTATDGLQFTVNGGTQLQFTFELQKQGTNRIFIGGQELEAQSDPVIFNLGN